MATKTEIANATFVKISANTVLNVEDDNGGQSVAFNAAFEIARREFLELHTWSWARKTRKLNATTNEPAFGFAAVYGFPSDFVTLFTTNTFPGDGYKTFEDGIHANSQPIIEYIFDANVDRFSASATKAFVLLMATEIVIPVKGSNTMLQNLVTLYDRAFIQAVQVSKGASKEARPISLEQFRFAGHDHPPNTSF